MPFHRAQKITREEYKVRWAYSELASDSNFSDDYPKGPETKRVREKARLKIKFDDLQNEDHVTLVQMIENSERAIPQGGLLGFLDDVNCLQLEHWTKAQVRATQVVPGLGLRASTGDFYDSFVANPGARFGDKDPRQKVAALDPATVYAAPAEAICVVPIKTASHGLLLEGTRRALTFLKLATDDDTIAVWTKSDC